MKINKLLSIKITFSRLLLSCPYFILSLFFLVFTSCNNHNHKHIGEEKVMVSPVDIDASAAEVIEATLEDAIANNGHLAHFKLSNSNALQHIYQSNEFAPVWSKDGTYTQQANALYELIIHAKQHGLFPEDYHAERIATLRQQVFKDTAKRIDKMDAAVWAETDLLLSSAFIAFVTDLKRGRLLSDEAIKRDTLLSNQFYQQQLQEFQQHTNMENFVAALEPKHTFYLDLKAALKNFLQESASLTMNEGQNGNSLNFSVQQRLQEDSITFESAFADSVELSIAIKKYQKKKGLQPDGKITDSLLSQLHKRDNDKFIQIAITLDKYKQLPDPLPPQFVWVNIPAYQLQVWDNGLPQLTSKVVVGKPQTQTPVLTSAISDMITYPQWHIPQSIIKKEILPGLQKDAGYTVKKGYSLIDKEGNEVDPYSINWAMYDDIPYKVVQGSGDDNALGILKFNFPNKHAVYLHDTNQRHLFSKEKRALSHGCVRVEAWEDLAYFLLQNDQAASTNAVPVDSFQTWMFMKEKHVIPVHKRIPLFIRYFTCEAQDGRIVFYDDVYGEDRKLKETFFSDK